MADVSSITNGFRKTFNVEGVGQFTLRRPTFWDRPQVSKVRAQLIGSGAVPEGDQGGLIADIIATINVTAEDKPRGFDWSELYADEMDPWFDFLEEYNDWISSFRKSKRAQAKAADSGSSQG